MGKNEEEGGRREEEGVGQKRTGRRGGRKRWEAGGIGWRRKDEEAGEGTRLM